jgi:quinol monooxygenase YgiN
MSDLNVVAVLTAKPGSEDLLEKTLKELREPSLAESGCISYELYRSAVDASAYITLEKWQSQADLEAHMKTPHIAAALGALGDALAGPPAIHPLVPVAV